MLKNVDNVADIMISIIAKNMKINFISISNANIVITNLLLISSRIIRKYVGLGSCSVHIAIRKCHKIYMSRIYRVVDQELLFVKFVKDL